MICGKPLVTKKKGETIYISEEDVKIIVNIALKVLTCNPT
jgi:hypothetical protein